MSKKDNLEPFELNDLALCFLKSNCFKYPHAILSMTHITETSTKTPIIFTGNLMTYGSIGNFSDPQMMINDFQILQSMPPSSIILPRYNELEQNLEWISLLEKNNDFCDSLKKYLQENGLMVNGLLGSEQLYNPYFRLNDDFYKEITQEEDIINRMRKIKKFELMKKNIDE